MCFGGQFVESNPNYLINLSNAFSGASIYYGTGVQGHGFLGFVSHPARPNEYGIYDGLHYDGNAFLNYQIFTPVYDK